MALKDNLKHFKDFDDYGGSLTKKDMDDNLDLLADNIDDIRNNGSSDMTVVEDKCDGSTSIKILPDEAENGTYIFYIKFIAVSSSGICRYIGFVRFDKNNEGVTANDYEFDNKTEGSVSVSFEEGSLVIDESDENGVVPYKIEYGQFLFVSEHSSEDEEDDI